MQRRWEIANIYEPFDKAVGPMLEFTSAGAFELSNIDCFITLRDRHIQQT